MKIGYLVIVLIAALVAITAVSKGFFHVSAVSVVAEESSSSDEAGDDYEYTEFA